MENVTALRGDDVTFHCKVDNLGKHLVFTRRDKYEVTIKPETDERILCIKQVDEYDIGAYLCQVNTEPVISRIGYLHLKAAPRVMKTTSPIIEVHEGHDVTLQCDAVGSPQPTVIWRRQDRQVIHFHGATGYGTTIFNGSVLAISRVSRKHMAEYVCTASNGIPPDSVFNVRLLVVFKPNVKAKTRAVSVPLGGQAKIVCNVEAWPNADVTWSKNGVEIFNTDTFAVAVESREKYMSLHSLTIKGVSRNDYDVYRCTAKNDVGTAYDEVIVREYTFPEVVAASDEERYSVVKALPEEKDDVDGDADEPNSSEEYMNSEPLQSYEQTEKLYDNAVYAKITPAPAKRRDLILPLEAGIANHLSTPAVLLLSILAVILRQ